MGSESVILINACFKPGLTRNDDDLNQPRTGGVMHKIFIGLGFGLLLAAATWAQIPNFDYPYLLPAATGYIAIDNACEIPEMGDWDGDGSIDLLLGVFYDGNIRYYHNSAPAGQTPVFNSYSMLRADGVNLSVTYG
jgi:hypothetical protein